MKSFANLSLGVSQALSCRVNYVCDRFITPFYHFCGVGLPAYFGNHSPFLMEQISFSRVLEHSQPSSPATGANSFLKYEMEFYMCAV